MIVEVLGKQAGPVQGANELILRGGGNRGHGCDPFMRM
jgi:hypothetical protein